MKIDQSKLERQKEIVKRWEEAGRRGTLEAATGFGKSYASVIGAKRYFEELRSNGTLSYHQQDKDYVLVVVVPYDHLRTDWRKYLSDQGFDKFGKWRVDTVHNIVEEEITTSMLIPDEVHRYVGETAEVFPTMFQKVYANAIFALTATLGEEGIRRDIINEYCPVFDEVTQKECLDNGWISSHVVYNLGIPMSEEDKRGYDKLNRKFKKWFKVFDFDFNKAKECCQSQEAARRHAVSHNMDTQYVRIAAVNTMRTIQERKKYLYDNPAKLRTARQIVTRFPNRKAVTFSQTTDFADQLAEAIGDRATAYHSSLSTQIRKSDGSVLAIGKKKKTSSGKKTVYVTGDGTEYDWEGIKQAYPNEDLTRMGKTRLRREAIEQFRDNRFNTNVLCSAMALDEGLDVQDIGLGIIASGTSKMRQNIQRGGRILRFMEGKQAIIVQLYILDSQDETWLESRQGNRDNVKWIYSIDEIAEE